MSKDAPAALPGWGDFATYYQRRWRYFGRVLGRIGGDLVRKNAARAILTLLILAAVAAGLWQGDPMLLMWPILLIVAGYALTVAWTWFASPWAVLRDEISEVTRLTGLVANQEYSKEVGDELRGLFFSGSDLLEESLCFDPDDILDPSKWVDRYKTWRRDVLEVLLKISREEEFMFISAGFQYDAIAFAELSSQDQRVEAVMRALPAKMEKLRRITGRSYKASESDAPSNED